MNLRWERDGNGFKAERSGATFWLYPRDHQLESSGDVGAPCWRFQSMVGFMRCDAEQCFGSDVPAAMEAAEMFRKALKPVGIAEMHVEVERLESIRQLERAAAEARAQERAAKAVHRLSANQTKAMHGIRAFFEREQRMPSPDELAATIGTSSASTRPIMNDLRLMGWINESAILREPPAQHLRRVK